MSSQKKVEVKAKNRVQQMQSRCKWTSERKKFEQKRTTARVKKHRLSQKAIGKETPTKVFNYAQALGKALRRVTRVLPKSPRRKIAVVKRLADHYGVEPNKAALSVHKHGNWQRI